MLQEKRQRPSLQVIRHRKSNDFLQAKLGEEEAATLAEDLVMQQLS